MRYVKDCEPEQVMVYGTGWCEETTYLRRQLDHWGIKHHYIDLDDEPHARTKVAAWNFGKLELPAVSVGGLELPRLIAPSDEKLHDMIFENGLVRVGPLLI